MSKLSVPTELAADDPLQAIRDASKARAFDRLALHLRAHSHVQNIELMLLADFCRNCLSQWLSEAEATEKGYFKIFPSCTINEPLVISSSISHLKPSFVAK